MDDRLKPCPFCGGKAKVGGSASLGRYAVCTKCLASSVSEATEEKAIERWNERHERTCTMEYQTGADNPKRGWYLCSECGGLSDSVGAGWNGEKKRMNPPTYCARCGAKVVE